MSLEPDRWCLPGDWPRHKLRAYGRIVRAPAGTEYRRLLNFLSKSAAQGERALLHSTPVPRFAQVPTIVNRRIRKPVEQEVAAFARQTSIGYAALGKEPEQSEKPTAQQAAVEVTSITFDEQNQPVEFPEAEPFTFAIPATSPYMEPVEPAQHVETVSVTGNFAESQSEDGEFLSHLALLLNEWFDNESIENTEEAPEVDSMTMRRERTQALLREYKGLSEKTEPERLLDKMSGATEAPRAKAKKESRNTEMSKTIVPVMGGRREVFRDGAYVEKDAVGRVIEARSLEGSIMSFSYDDKGHLKSFVRSDLTGKIHTTGVKDRHGVVVRDEHGSVRAQGDSMTVDPNGCVSIRKFDGQFWSVDVLKGIHIERRILEDANGGWNCLTALLTGDGFRMVTRFQKLQENKRESYRKYGDWLGSTEASRFRFYGRDGSMIQFENDEDLEALRPSRIWPAGSRQVEREWVGRRQAGTAWEAVHRYVSQYLSAL